MYKELLLRLNPLNIYYYLRHIQIITSSAVFKSERTFLFNIYKKDYRVYKKHIEPPGPSMLPLDIIIPVIEKDLNALPFVISGIRNHVKHPVQQIYIVAPNAISIRDVAAKNGCIFVDETTVCAITKQQINFIINGKDRSGWIYQQLLKLNFDKIGTCENYLVVDADTVFIKDIAFENEGRLYFDFSDEFHEPYYKAYELLTSLKHNSKVSFVAHYMLFAKCRLKELKTHIEYHNNANYADTIIQLKEKVVNDSNFSEYETYANFCVTQHPNKYLIRYWFNKSLHITRIKEFMEVADKYKNIYKSLSFHSYN